MFKDNENNLSITKIMSFIGFLAFLITSGFVIWLMPDKFNYELYAILTGGGAVGTRILDKYMNISNNKKDEQKQSVFPPLPL